MILQRKRVKDLKLWEASQSRKNNSNIMVFMNEMLSKLAKSLFILITLSDTLWDVSNEHCILCKYQIIQTHNAEIARLLNQPRPSIVANFNSTPICETPLGEKLNLDDLKTIYAKNYPVWNKKFQCFPP